MNLDEKQQLRDIKIRLLQGLAVMLLPAIMALLIDGPVALGTGMAFVVVGVAVSARAIFRLYRLFQEIQVREIAEKAASDEP